MAWEFLKFRFFGQIWEPKLAKIPKNRQFCPKCHFFLLQKFSQPQPFKLETPNFHQLLALRLQKIARSPIFYICLNCQNFGRFIPLLRNNCQKLRNNYQNLGNQGKYQKSGSERFFVILRRVIGENLVFLA